jgi:hypothetical protein
MERGNMKTVSLTSTEYRSLKNSGQMADIGALDGTPRERRRAARTYGDDSPNYPIWDGRTMEWVMVVVVDSVNPPAVPFRRRRQP